MINGLAVNAYSAENNRFYSKKIRKSQNKYFLEDSRFAGKDTNLYLTPGWIDIHTHIFDGFGLFGTNADEIGYKTGVCMLADAGTIGDYTIGGFRKYVMPTIKTNFRIFLCISPIGIIFHHEYNAIEYLDVNTTVKTVENNRDIICGIKVRMGSETIRHEGLEPLRLASEAARLVKLPLMVHIGGNPPFLTDMEPFFMEGDIITHCFNKRGEDVWNVDGTPSETMKKLIDRGVILDVGHGGASFSFETCEKAMLQGINKFCISSDLHARSKKHIFDMATILTKIHGLSLSLEDCIYNVTYIPSQILRMENWCDISELRNATFFRIENLPGEYQDANGNIRRFLKRIIPVGVILNRKYIHL
ncbi:MAG: hypothetical protein SCM11_08735 [Bacillota bacterium]|nr:hypothetical protein [Bacillota bacterium]